MSQTHPHRPLSTLLRRSPALRFHPPILGRFTVTLCLLPLILPTCVYAQKPQSKGKQNPTAASLKANINAGRTLFVKNCSPCHGATGQGGEGPSLLKLTMTDATIATTIKNGIKGEMPAFNNKFKDADLKALTAFLQSIKK